MKPRFPYEKRNDRLASRAAFSKRLALNALLAAGVIVLALLIGMLGYSTLGGLGAIDSFLNAAMILSGMGPVATLEGHDAAKIFAGTYAIFCGLLIFAVAGLILAPVLHRILHRFHVQDDDGDRRQ